MEYIDKINKYIVVKNKRGDNFDCYMIMEISNIKKVYCYNSNIQKFSEHTSNNIELTGVIIFKQYLTGNFKYTRFEIDLNLNNILDLLIYSSNCLDECEKHIGMLINLDKYNL